MDTSAILKESPQTHLSDDSDYLHILFKKVT